MTQGPQLQELLAAVRKRNKLTPFRIAMRSLFESLRNGGDPVGAMTLLQLAVCTKDGTLSGVREELHEYLEDLGVEPKIRDGKAMSQAVRSFGRRKDAEPVDVPEDPSQDPEPETDDDPLNLEN